MLSRETVQIIKSTAPVLADEGEKITRLFYKKLFANHPELKNVFNMTHQAKGDQARALADSVFAYATHIDQLNTLGPVVNRIAHKHASLQVAPEHYPIVGKYLLEAIQDHLKLNADDPVLEAWADAYGVLADIFIQTEENIYQTNEEMAGGWRGYRPFTISKIVEETPTVKSFHLQPEDKNPIIAFRPGQYVGVRTHPETSEYDEVRQYSLSNAPGENHYRITVKAEAADAARPGHVSNFLHAASVGDTLLLQPPTGDFVVNKSSTHPVCIGGGIGITPLMSMLLNAINEGKNLEKLVFIQCCQDSSHHVMHDELRALSNEHNFAYHVAYERGDGADHLGYLNAAVLEKWLPDRPNGQVYLCGPTAFMSTLSILLRRLGYAEEQLHYEIFGPRVRFGETG